MGNRHDDDVGTIEGGTVANAVPGYAKMVVDVRYLDPVDFEKKKEQFQAIADKVYIKDVTTKYTPLAGLEPMVRLDGSMKLFDVYKSVYEENGFGHPEPINGWRRQRCYLHYQSWRAYCLCRWRKRRLKPYG